MNDASRQEHWEHIYTTKGESEVSWFQENLGIAFRRIQFTLHVRKRGDRLRDGYELLFGDCFQPGGKAAHCLTLRQWLRIDARVRFLEKRELFLELGLRRVRRRGIGALGKVFRRAKRPFRNYLLFWRGVTV